MAKLLTGAQLKYHTHVYLILKSKSQNWKKKILSKIRLSSDECTCT